MKKVLLCIMDGVGLSKTSKKNALESAFTPTLDKLFKEYPNTTLEASGKYVGLPEGQMGNSEVGHSNIGAGRVIYQSLEYINNKIKDKSFFENEQILNLLNYVKTNKTNLHLMGLLSDGGIHSNINHLYAILDMCKEHNINNVYIHVFTDGRDTKVDSALGFVKELSKKIKELGIGKIVSVSGRFYIMDRDNRYERIKPAYEAIVEAKGINYETIEDAITDSYFNNVTDEFIVPATIDGGRKLEENDAIFIYNYRPDRLREILTVLTDKKFKEFPIKVFNHLEILTMMPVLDNKYAPSAFKLPTINNTLGEYVSKQGLSQLRIAETEKYAHVTYFFDGGVELNLKKEKKLLIPSPKVLTYDLKPEMSCYEITKKLIKEIKRHKYDLVVLNFANGDMVGHTGNYEAAIKAVEAVDKCLDIITNKIDLNAYTLIITADHGNCEVMENEDGSVNTNHTTNKVPFIVTDKNIKLQSGKLSNIAPTILDIMDIEKPVEMEENSLIL